MKKVILGICIGIAVTLPTSLFAETALTKIEAYLNPILPIKLDGKQLQLENSPITYDGSTYLPLREAGTILGLNVGYDETTGTVLLDSVLKAGNGVDIGSDKIDPIKNEKDSDKVSNINQVEFTPLTEWLGNNRDVHAEPDYANRKMHFIKDDVTVTVNIDDLSQWVIKDDIVYINKNLLP